MNLFVGNLSTETTEEHLHPLFSEFGKVVSAKVIKDLTTGMSRGFGFVEMADKNAAIDAIDNLDSVFFLGNIISVKEAKQNTTKNGSQGGGRNFTNRPYSRQRNNPPDDNFNRF